MSRPLLENRLARRLFLDRHLLLGQQRGSGRGTDLNNLLTELGFVQMDSVSTLARAHDLILWARRGQYRPRFLERLVATDRLAFEHWTHDAAVIPIEFYPRWRLKFARDESRMRSRWSQEQRRKRENENNRVLRYISDHGPACSLDVRSDDSKGSSGWWDWHPSKFALEFLWRSGALAICHRRGFRKYYDLAERVIPRQYRETYCDDNSTVEWAMGEALARLGFGTSGELAAFFGIVTPEEAKRWCAEALSSRRVVEADVELYDGSRRRSFVTQNALDEAGRLPEPSSRVRLLSPFDPAFRDRKRAERLFGFHYRIEIYVPEAKRRYGYYVFPVLQGDRVIGRLDVKRVGNAIQVRAFWPEAGVRMGGLRIAALEAELERAARLADATGVTFCHEWLRT